MAKRSKTYLKRNEGVCMFTDSVEFIFHRMSIRVHSAQCWCVSPSLNFFIYCYCMCTCDFTWCVPFLYRDTLFQQRFVGEFFRSHALSSWEEWWVVASFPGLVVECEINQLTISSLDLIWYTSSALGLTLFSCVFQSLQELCMTNSKTQSET